MADIIEFPTRAPFALGGAITGSSTISVADEKIARLVAQNEAAWSLACAERAKAEEAVEAQGRSWVQADMAGDTMFAETHRLEGIARELFERIIDRPARTVRDLLAKLE